MLKWTRMLKKSKKLFSRASNYISDWRKSGSWQRMQMAPTTAITPYLLMRKRLQLILLSHRETAAPSIIITTRHPAHPSSRHMSKHQRVLNNRHQRGEKGSIPSNFYRMIFLPARVCHRREVKTLIPLLCSTKKWNRMRRFCRSQSWTRIKVITTTIWPKVCWRTLGKWRRWSLPSRSYVLAPMTMISRPIASPFITFAIQKVCQ